MEPRAERPSLIVNADDLGLSREVNRAIAAGHTQGIVTAVSLMSQGAAYAEAVQLLREHPALDVGVHLSLSDGLPLCPAGQVRSLVDGKGAFLGLRALLVRHAQGRVRFEEVAAEWHRQILRAEQDRLQLTHLDSHLHLHMLPGLFDIAVELARRHGIGWIRVAFDPSLAGAFANGGGAGRVAKTLAVCAASAGRRRQALAAGLRVARLRGLALTRHMREASLLGVLEGLDEGVTEIMCHPAGDEPGRAELAALCSPLVAQTVKRAAHLVSFAEAGSGFQSLAR